MRLHQGDSFSLKQNDFLRAVFGNPFNKEEFLGIFTEKGVLKNNLLDVEDILYMYYLSPEENQSVIGKIKDFDIDILLKANILFTLGNKQEAVEILEEYIGIHDGNEYIYFHLGFYCEELYRGKSKRPDYLDKSKLYYSKIDKKSKLEIGNTTLGQLISNLDKISGDVRKSTSKILPEKS